MGDKRPECGEHDCEWGEVTRPPRWSQELKRKIRNKKTDFPVELKKASNFYFETVQRAQGLLKHCFNTT